MTDGPRWTRRVRVDVRTWTGELTPALMAWLGDNYVSYAGDQLTVRQADGHPVTLPAGWVLVRHPDGALIVHSLAAAERALEPTAPCPACRRADQAGLAPDEQHPHCASTETH